MSIFEDLPIVENITSEITPGEILKEMYLEPLNISAYKLAKEIKVPQTRVSEIINKGRSITTDTALRFAKFFGTTPELWLNLQRDYELKKTKSEKADELELIHHY